MALFPIVARELRVASRRPATFRTRTYFAIAAAGLLLWRLSTLAHTPQASQGRTIFLSLFILAFIYALSVGARTTADTLSLEKREGTLGLLFLTDLKGVDIVLGKLFASSLNASYGLIAMIPFMALPLLMGGVTPLQFIKAAAILLNTLLFSLSIGLFVSSVSVNERRALFATIVLTGLAILGPPVIAYYLIDNLTGLGWSEPQALAVAAGVLATTPFLGIIDIAGGFGPLMVPFYLLLGSHGWLLLVSVWLITLSNRITSRAWNDRATNSRWKALGLWWHDFLHGTGAVRKALRARLLDLNPFVWLVSRERLKQFYVWAFVVCAALIWLWGRVGYGDVMLDWYPLAPNILLIHGFVKVWVASEASHRMVEDQRVGAMELLLTTPMTPERLVQGQWLAFKRQFVGPLILLCVLEWIAFSRAIDASVIIAVQIVLWVDVLALVYLAMWNGLTAKTLTIALLRSCGLILFVPWAVHLLFVGPSGLLPRWTGVDQPQVSFDTRLNIWLAISVLNSVFWGLYIGRRHLLKDFRSAALRRFSKARSDGAERAEG